MVQIVVTGNNVASTTELNYQAGLSNYSVPNIPINVPLQITINCLNTFRQILTTWKGNCTLSTGRNTIAANLIPPMDKIGVVTITPANFSSLTEVSANPSMPQFVQMNFTSAFLATDPNNPFFQIVANSGGDTITALEFFDANWNRINPYLPIASDGSGVFNVTGPTTVNVMASSVGASLAANLQVRYTRFVSPAGSGGQTGTPVAPIAGLGSILNGSNLNNYSVFAAAGNYPNTSSCSWQGDVRVYGGCATNFSSRDVNARGTIIRPATIIDASFSIPATGSGRMEGLTIYTRDSPGATFYQSGVVTNSPKLVITNCSINGSENLTTFVASTTIALSVESGNPIISYCTIDGGKNAQASTGIAVINGRPFINHCDIGGGFVSVPTGSGGIATSTAIAINPSGFTTNSVVINACRIYGGLAIPDPSSTTASYSYGISYKPSNSANPVIIANCMINGGQVQGIDSTICAGILRVSNANSQNMVVIGSTVDSGYLNTSKYNTYANNSAIYGSNFANMTIAGCVFSISSLWNPNLANLGFAILSSTGAMPTLVGNTAFGPFPNGNACLFAAANIALPNSPPSAGNITSPLNASAVYSTYSISQSALPQWLGTNNYRPVSTNSDLAGFVDPSIYIPAADKINFPDLLSDLQGVPRNGNWTRGAYQ